MTRVSVRILILWWMLSTGTVTAYGQSAGYVREKGTKKSPQVVLTEAEIESARKRVMALLQGQHQRPLPRPRIELDKPVDFWKSVENFDAAKGDKQKLSWWFAGYLHAAEQLLQSDDVETRSSGLSLAYLVALNSRSKYKDSQLAADVCEGWLIPNLDAAQRIPTRFPNRLAMVKLSASTFLAAERYQRAEQLSLAWIGESTNRNAADAGRLRLAESFVRQEQPQKAREVLSQIRDPSLRGSRDKLLRQLKPKSSLSRD